jgi:malonyl-CoA O-methyltransferase
LSIKSEFSEHANDYDGNNIIQRIVSRALVREVENNPKRILELGCGSGQVYRQIDWDLVDIVVVMNQCLVQKDLQAF